MEGTTFSNAQLACLASSYSPLSNKEMLLDILGVFLNIDGVRQRPKYDIVKIYNDILISNYSGESVLKYLLFKEYLTKNVTAAFEIKVNSSRADFLAVNGHTTSFEIKSELDSLRRLKKQSTDYSKAFEFNNVVVHAKHLEQSTVDLPDHYGIWFFENGTKKIARKASRSCMLDAEFQLQLLSTRELRSGFPEVRGNRKEILKAMDFERINTRFKQQLKLRYTQRWSFLKVNSQDIFPIDVQFFFSTNLSPELVYGIKQPQAKPSCNEDSAPLISI